MKFRSMLTLTAVVSFSAVVASTSALAAGDAAKGKTLYATCGACHGANGEGQEALNAPKLAGQQDWYLIRQLENFKAGIRGTNPKDTYGMQMMPMAQTLPTAKDIADVVAYIKTLK